MHLSLNNIWKFKTGDDIAYAGRFDDSKWNSGRLYGDSPGFIWYRIKIVIPRSLRINATNDSLAIYMGRIADCDQVFLNGSIIGENSVNVSAAPVPDSSFTEKPSDARRKYLLSIHDRRILWDQPNLIAIRVFNQDVRPVPSDNPYIGAVSTADSLSFNRDEFYRPEQYNRLDTGLIVKNSSFVALTGQVIIRCANKKTGLEVQALQIHVAMKPKSSIVLPVSLPYSEDPVKVYLTYVDHDLNITRTDSIDIPFILNR